MASRTDGAALRPARPPMRPAEQLYDMQLQLTEEDSRLDLPREGSPRVRGFEEIVIQVLGDARQRLLVEHKKLLRVHEKELLQGFVASAGAGDERASVARGRCGECHIPAECDRALRGAPSPGPRATAEDEALVGARETDPCPTSPSMPDLCVSEDPLTPRQPPLFSSEDRNSADGVQPSIRHGESTSSMHHSSTGSKPGMGMSLKDVIELGAERRGVRAERMSKSLRNRLLTDAVLQSSIAETVISIIIMLNIIVIGLSADIALDWGGWVVVDALFAAVFLLESIVKLRLVGLCTFFLGPDRCWNLFEAVLAWLAVMEVALNLMSNKSGDDSRFSLLRIFRLLRITRVVRVCRIPAFADLMMMINGAIGGTRTLLWSVVLISVPLYAVALFFRETLGAYSDQGQGAEVFRSLPWSFFVVFSCVVSSECNTEDGVPLMLSVIKHYGWHFGLIYCVTMLLMTFGLFNVIMAIYVENTVAAAKYNDVGLKRQRLRDQQLVAEKLHELLELTCNIWYTKQDRKRVSGSSGGDSKTAETVLSVDVWNAMGPNGDLYKSTLQDSLGLEITPAFLEELRGDSRFNSLLRDLDISDENTMDLFETLDADGGGTIDVEELITGIVKLRGDARRSDIVAVSLVVRNLHKLVASLEERSEQMHEELRAMRNAAGVSSRNGLTSSYSGSLAGSSRAPTVADRGSVQSNFRQLEI